MDTKVTDPAKTEIATLQAQLAAASARISELESELGSEVRRVVTKCNATSLVESLVRVQFWAVPRAVESV